MVAPLREQLQEYHYRSLTLEGNIVAAITQDRVIDDNLKKQITTKLCVLVDYSYYPKFFNILAIGQKYFSFYPIANFFMVNNFSVD